MKKLIKGAVVTALLLTVGTGVTSCYAGANTMTNVSEKSDGFEGLNKLLQEKLRGMGRGYSHTQLFAGKMKLSEEINDYNKQKPLNVTQTPVVTPNDDMKIVEGEALAANTTTFSNKTGTQMTYNTPSFTYKNTNSATTNTTHAVELGLTTSATMKFPFVSGSMSMSAKYNFSTGASETTTEEYSWTVPSQNIPVKPNQKIRVDWLLKTGKAEGTVQLTDRIGANIPYKINQFDQTLSTKTIGEIVSLDEYDFYQKDWDRFVGGSREEWTTAPTPENGKADFTVGEARYSAKYGTEMVMQVVDVTGGVQKAKVIKTIPVKANVKPVKEDINIK